LIESLRIENLAIVEEAELEFGPGLNVLTGETGAGKSIVLGALSLLVGARAEPGALREGVAQGGVEALFRTESLPDLEAELAGRDLAAADPNEEDAHALVVRRTLSSTGRSRARVGGQLVPVSTLAELFTGRVEVSSQHSSQSLLRPETHGWLLDESAGLQARRAAVAEAFESLRALDEELSRLRGEAAERERQRDFVAHQLAEIDAVGLERGELAGIESEHARLAHADALRREGTAALLALRGDEAGEASSAADALVAAVRAGEEMARMDPAQGDWVARLRVVSDEVFDAARELERYVDRIEADPEALTRLDERIGAIEKLRRKYGRDEDEIFATRDTLAASLDETLGADARIESLAAPRDAHEAAHASAASTLTRARRRAAKKLSAAVESGLHELAMPEASFAVALDAPTQTSGWPEGAVAGPGGSEVPEFRFTANPGESPRSLRRVASGGELSRVFLAIKNALRRAGPGMVLVFDEVDAGVGGRVAERVGRALAELSASHQVLCITHLPQIAAFADRHFRVEKSARRGRTRTRITHLDEQARVEEIARMAAGEDVTEATRRHARALIAAAAGA